MSAFTSARKALETRLYQTAGIPVDAGVPRVAWDNVEFKVPDKLPWLRSTFQPVERRTVAVGENSPYLHQGLYLVDCYGTMNGGANAADALADIILARFSHGLGLTESGYTVRIRYAERTQGIADAPWYFVPITVSWYLYEHLV
jgi:hypothetical protein